MITIQSVMLVTLGVLAAAFIGLLVAPAYRRRTVRLATEALKRSLPLSEAEIRADKDRLRAEYAVLISSLESKVTQAGLAAARQRIELNRRDAAISRLEGEISRIKTSIEEHENARRVLEQTVRDRLPKVEQRLAEARKMLLQRDHEIAQLTQSAERQSQALEEATQINTQQREDLHRLNAALTTRAARNRETLGDPRFDSEVAMRSELEVLRTRTRDQESMIGRLQGLLVRSGLVAGGASPSDHEARTEAEIARLRESLSEAEAALKSVRNVADAGKAGQEALEGDLRALKASNQDQAAEIARLRAALQAWQGGDNDESLLKDSKIALKARVSALQAESEERAATIQRLRAEVASSNERMARQASQFRDEMRRLGVGTVPTTGPVAPVANEPQRRSLTDRINDPRETTRAPKIVGASSREEPAQESSRVSGFLRALDNTGEVGPQPGSPNGAASHAAQDAKPDGEALSNGTTPARKKLLERITGLDKPPSSSSASG